MGERTIGRSPRGGRQGRLDGVLVIDGSGTVRYANHAARAMLGRAHLVGVRLGVPVGRPVTTVDLLLPGGESRRAELEVLPGWWGGAAASVAILRVADGDDAAPDTPGR